jgi:hypothetical protein
MLEKIRASLSAQLEAEIVDQLLETYVQLKREYYLNHLRPNEVEGGRFAEAAHRVLQSITRGRKVYTPLGRQIKDFEKECEDFRNLPTNQFPESIRIHIPRTIRLVYDIRNKRDAAHLGDHIDPNLQDATLVMVCCDWVMAEFVRLLHNVGADEAHRIIDSLVERKCPAVQSFGDFLKTLNPALGPTDRLNVLLYERAATGATEIELQSWLKPSQRRNLRRTLLAMEHEKDLITNRHDKYYITHRGILYAEKNHLLEPPSV